MRHTKIIATVGPASDSEATLDALIAAGTDIFRLNFSHGTHETQAATFARVRAASARRLRGGDPPGSRRAEDPHRPASRAASRSRSSRARR